MTDENLRKQNPSTSANQSAVYALTSSEIEELREDLRRSVILANEIIKKTPCKVDLSKLGLD